MAEAKAILTSRQNEESSAECLKTLSSAVKLRCNVACDLLQQYDGFFARLSSPRKDVTPNTIAEAHRFITKNANILVHQLKMSVTQGTRCAGIYTPYYVTCFINGAATS
jgi:hypothetical protein